ncbi:MAG: HD domain-containing phosphohydrolase [Gemmataceae bacterium]
MSDVKGLLERISAFRQRLEATPRIIPEAIPLEGGDSEVPAGFRDSLKQIAGSGNVVEGPLPPLTDRARELLGTAQTLLARQKKFSQDSFVAGLNRSKAAANDPLIAYHRETTAVLDCAIRLAQAFPESPSVQLQLCEGLHGLLAHVSERLLVQERALGLRRTDEARIDRIAAVYSAMHHSQAIGLNPVAGLAEELLEDARQAKPLRFVAADLFSAQAFPGSVETTAPARHLAAHAVNVAQVVARMTPYDFEWASRPLVPVVAALMMDCGMMRVPLAVLAKADALNADERRLVEGHAVYGAELLNRNANDASALSAAVATHHERSDGTGYPSGLKGTGIPSLGRMLAVADTYTALCSPRSYRSAQDTRAALTDVLLLAEHGQLDKDFAEYLVHLNFYPVGTVVELTDGRVGSVAANHANRLDPRTQTRPIVAVLADADGTLLPRPEHVDLAQATRCGILRTVPAERRRELLARRHPDLG